MGKFRRAGYVFLSWKGDHGPRHVYVYRAGRFVAKRDLDSGKVMRGSVTARVLRVIRELQSEDLL